MAIEITHYYGFYQKINKLANRNLRERIERT
jgi:hypothetical protein